MIFGGADFGAGWWDLVAGGAQRSERPREIIDHSFGPVWEANHVWLIFAFVVLWTCFPEAYASAGVLVLRNDAPYLFHGLTSRALVLVIISVVSGLAALWLIARTPRRGGRLAAVMAVGALVVAWGVAQWDYILP